MCFHKQSVAVKAQSTNIKVQSGNYGHGQRIALDELIKMNTKGLTVAPI